MKISTKQLVFTALLIALSFIGAQLKVFGTIAFDSLPAFLGTFLLGPVYGAIIGFAGHILTSATSGFPFTFPVHFLIGIGMGVTMIATWFVFNLFNKRNQTNVGLIISVLVAALFNGPVLCLLSSPLLIPMLTWPGVVGMMVPLALVGGINAAVGAVVFRAIPASLKTQLNLDASKVRSNNS
ncbi:ECF transporter S component [Eubacteriaceae bacterium ES3]|nr:ECF transporter S component [Eubacteriaceae bacterium ES3]